MIGSERPVPYDIAHICALLDSGLTQTQVAEKLGVSQATVSRKTAERRKLARLKGHERAALVRLLDEVSKGPGFSDRWSPLDMLTCVLALRRVSGVG